MADHDDESTPAQPDPQPGGSSSRPKKKQWVTPPQFKVPEWATRTPQENRAAPQFAMPSELQGRSVKSMFKMRYANEKVEGESVRWPAQFTVPAALAPDAQAPEPNVGWKFIIGASSVLLIAVIVIIILIVM